MKIKTIFGVLGTVALLGGTAYVVIKYLEKKTAENKKDAIDTDSKDDKLENAIATNKKEDEQSYLKNIKIKMTESIEQRHGEAKSIMEEAVKNVMWCDNTLQTKNDEEKKQLFEDIDKM